eukprot:TRINITY_DN22184_c0_g1_i1.p1 TRINITY_DN22184_c0_g1~~TRINITY_DN22184_c0_g1_i1.p1  ORF type:complete len:240 (+),score=40.79 TRINITY_DN22184_c0_g1_i1:160-879(+)
MPLLQVRTAMVDECDGKPAEIKHLKFLSTAGGGTPAPQPEKAEQPDDAEYFDAVEEGEEPCPLAAPAADSSQAAGESTAFSEAPKQGGALPAAAVAVAEEVPLPDSDSDFEEAGGLNTRHEGSNSQDDAGRVLSTWTVVYQSNSDYGDVVLRGGKDLKSDILGVLRLGQSVEQTGQECVVSGITRMPIRLLTGSGKPPPAAKPPWPMHSTRSSLPAGSLAWVSSDATAVGGPLFFKRIS